MGSSDLFRNEFFTVYPVHKAHNSCILTCNHSDALQCSWQRTVFQRNDQQVCRSCFLRCPYFRMIHCVIDQTAFFHPFCALSFCDHTQSDILPSGKSPYHIRANCSCTENGDRFYLHFSYPLLFCIFLLLLRANFQNAAHFVKSVNNSYSLI